MCCDYSQNSGTLGCGPIISWVLRITGKIEVRIRYGGIGLYLARMKLWGPGRVKNRIVATQEVKQGHLCLEKARQGLKQTRGKCD